MASEDRTTTQAVEFWQKLGSRPHRFEFFEAMRRLECFHRDRPRLGRSRRPSDDPFRLGQEPSLLFAPSTLARVEPGTDGRPHRLAVFFLGLFGPNGPLPLHLTEHARDRERNSGDRTFRRFADLFHHRMLSLFYRAWADARPTVHGDRPQSDRFLAYVGSLFGMGMPTDLDRDSLPDAAKLHHAGVLACQTRHADGLEGILRSYFKVPVELVQFQGHWLELPQTSHWRLGGTPETGSLGQTTVAGARMWDGQCKFRLRVGPLSLEEFERFLPTRESLERLSAVVRNYIGEELLWDVQLVLDREQVPPWRLADDCRLGWTTWVTSRTLEQDAQDVVLDPGELRTMGAQHSKRRSNTQGV